MKKLLIICILLCTSCSIKVIKNQEETIDTLLNNKVSFFNETGLGYKYYLPKEVNVILKNNYNETLKYKNYNYYLAINIVDLKLISTDLLITNNKIKEIDKLIKEEKEKKEEKDGETINYDFEYNLLLKIKKELENFVPISLINLNKEEIEYLNNLNLKSNNISNFSDNKDNYYYKELDKGYIKVYEQDNDKYLVNYYYNYSYIETEVNYNDLENTLYNCSYILFSMKYDNNIINNIYNNDLINNDYEVFSLKKPKEEINNYLGVADKKIVNDSIEEKLINSDKLKIISE